MTTAAQVDDLVTGAEAARRLGVTRQRVAELAERDDFPQSVGKAGVANLYSWAAIAAWAETWERKPGRPRTTDTTS